MHTVKCFLSFSVRRLWLIKFRNLFVRLNRKMSTSLKDLPHHQDGVRKTNIFIAHSGFSSDCILDCRWQLTHRDLRSMLGLGFTIATHLLAMWASQTKSIPKCLSCILTITGRHVAQQFALRPQQQECCGFGSQAWELSV